MSYTAASHLTNKPRELQHLLDFYLQEIQFLEKLLSEVVNKNTSQEALAEAEHFQNQFIVKDDIYDHIMHDLKMQSYKWKEIQSFSSKDLHEDLKKIRKNLSDQIEFIERDHAVLTKDYNTYLDALLLKD
jgi:hypothetical protein